MDNKNKGNCDCNHDHEHGACDCGNYDEMDIIHLTLEDDSELECSILGTFEVADKEYIALVPLDSEEAYADQVLLYRYEEDEDGIVLINIEDEEEFDKVIEAFYMLFEEMDLEDEYFDYYDEDYEEGFDEELDEEFDEEFDFDFDIDLEDEE